MKQTNKKYILTTMLSIFGFIGFYNAMVINSQSNLADADVKFVKRLDEVYGVVTPGRHVASAVEWSKIPNKISHIKAQSLEKTELTETNSTAAIQAELRLNLIEVINPIKWEKGLTREQFSGNLATTNGVIESFNLNIESENFSFDTIEMAGNIFEYDIEGEKLTGVIYQVDQHSFMVTLTNGPLEGTRLRFSSISHDEQMDEIERELTENHKIEVANFGETSSFEG